MKIAPLLLGAVALVFGDPMSSVQAQNEKSKPPADLIDQVVKSKDRSAFYPAYLELSRRVEQGEAEGEAAVRLLLGRRGEITAEPNVEGLLEGLVAEKKSPLAAELLLAITQAKNTVATYRRGCVAVGRVVVADGKLDPEFVLAQMPILPEGYFVGEVGDLERPIGFWAEGYSGFYVPLKGKTGEVVYLGTVTLKPLSAEDAASLRGKVTLDDADGAGTTSLLLSLDVPPLNTPHNGYSPRRRWPEPISIPVAKSGDFTASGLTPGSYLVIAEAKGNATSMKQVSLRPGRETDAGAIGLKANDLGFYIGKPTPKAGELPWEKDYPAALRKAQAEKRPLMVMMTATWCGPCKMLEKETLDDPWIKSFLSDFVIVQAFEDKAVEEKYGANGYPTLVFADSEGKEAYRTSGYRERIPFAGVCVAAHQKLGRELPAGLKALVEKKVIPPDR